jgi:hypothetical protein
VSDTVGTPAHPTPTPPLQTVTVTGVSWIIARGQRYNTTMREGPCTYSDWADGRRRREGSEGCKSNEENLGVEHWSE